MVTGIIGDRGVIYKLLTLLAIMLYSIVFGTVRSYYERLYYFCYYSDASVHSQTSGRSACVGKTSTGHAGYNRTSGRGGSRNLKACRHEDGWYIQIMQEAPYRTRDLQKDEWGQKSLWWWNCKYQDQKNPGGYRCMSINKINAKEKWKIERTWWDLLYFA